MLLGNPRRFSMGSIVVLGSWSILTYMVMALNHSLTNVYFVGSFLPQHHLMAEYAVYRAEFNAGRIKGREAFRY